MLKRVFSEPHNRARMIRSRQVTGSLTSYIDCQGYVCYDDEELEKWEPQKRGRKPRMAKVEQ